MPELRICLHTLLFLALTAACRVGGNEDLMNQKKVMEHQLQANTKEAQVQKELAVVAKEQRLFAEAEATRRMASVRELVTATENQQAIVDEAQKELQFLKQQLEACSGK